MAAPFTLPNFGTKVEKMLMSSTGSQNKTKLLVLKTKPNSLVCITLPINMYNLNAIVDTGTPTHFMEHKKTDH